MSEKTVLYIARHGQTYFNRSQRVQGWSDTPLTPEGAQNITYLGKGLKDIPFKNAYSSDAGRARETAQLVLAEHNDQAITHQIEPRIREWGFGSYEGELESNWMTELAKIGGYASAAELRSQDISFEDMANAIHQLDNEGWAENYEMLVTRIMAGYRQIAEETAAQGGGNVFAVSHGLTIALFLSLIDKDLKLRGLENGSISKIIFEDGQFTIAEANNMSYMDNGR